MITKHDFILLGSYFCEMYSNVKTNHGDVAVYYPEVWDILQPRSGVIGYSQLADCVLHVPY